MYPLFSNSGSNAMPFRPRSVKLLTLTVRKGSSSNVPFLMTRRSPPCSLTKSLPSGENAIEVGLVKPSANSESKNAAEFVVFCKEAAANGAGELLLANNATDGIETDKIRQSKNTGCRQNSTINL